MPMIIPAVVAIAATAALEGAVIAGITISATMAAVAGGALAMASSFVIGAMGGSSSKPNTTSASQDVQGRAQMIRSPVAPRRTVYGNVTRLSGVMVFAATSPRQDKANGFLHLVIALASHQLSAINEIWLDDQQLTLVDNGSSTFVPVDGTPHAYGTGANDGYVHVEKFLGSTSQAVCGSLIDANVGWTGSHELLGIAYLYVRLEWDANGPSQWPTGMPNIAANVTGKPLFDLRSSTVGNTNNFALVIYDYLTSSDYGLGCSSSAEINATDFIAAANLCDEPVTKADGTTELRYTCDGTFTWDQKPIDVIDKLLTSGLGALVYSQGAYSLFPAASASPTVTLTENDLRGPIKMRARPSRQDLYNAVKGVYTAADGQVTDFPEQLNPTYEAQDGTERIYRALELPFTLGTERAQRIAKIVLERGRQGITVEFPAKLTALQIRCWDVVYLTVAKFGWSSKAFRVTAWVLSTSGGVDLTLQEESSASYNWNAGMATTVDPAPDTNLPDPFNVPKPDLALTDEIVISASGIPVTQLIATVSGAPEASIVAYEAQYQRQGDSVWRDVGGGSRIVIAPVIDQEQYNVRVRSVTILGARSAWATASRTVIGQSTPPDDVTSFSINIIGDNAVGTWKPVGNIDLAYYRIRWSPLTSGAIWPSAIDLVPRVATPATSVQVGALVGTYLIKAVNYQGIESRNATLSVSTIAGVLGLNLVQTFNEAPSFAGTKTDVFVDGSGLLRLDTASLVSSWPSISGIPLISYGTSGIRSQGTYKFAGTPFDLGAVFTSRVTGSLQCTGSLVTNKVSLWPSVSGRQTISGTSASEHSTRLLVRTTNDDPAGAPTWSAWRDFTVGDYTCRAFDLEAILESYKNDVTPLVSALSVRIDMPDRVISGTVSSSSGGSTTVALSPAFKVAPVVGVTINDMAQGDRWTVSSITTAQFVLDVWNSVGTRVVRSCSYFVRGYGQ